MNTSGKSLSTMSAGASCGTCSPGATTTAESPEEEPKSAVAANEPSWAAVCVAPHDGVKRAEVDVVVVIELAGQQNHAGAGTEHRFAGGDMLCNRLEQAGGAQQLALRGALAARGRITRSIESSKSSAARSSFHGARGDPAWRRARRTRPARRGCRSRHVSRLRRRPILPSKCIQLLQPLPFLCFRMCRLRGASRCPRSRRHACAVRAVTRHGRP